MNYSLYDLKNYNRIIVIGSPGSGKSYFSIKLAKLTGHPLIHLDAEFWRPGWTETPKDEWWEKQSAMITGERWLIDGNYGGTMELRFAAADAVVFLDVNRFVCLRAVWERHGTRRPDLPDYLEENRKGRDFLKFMLFILSFPNKSKKKILGLHEKYPGKLFIVLKTRRAVDEILHLTTAFRGQNRLFLGV